MFGDDGGGGSIYDVVARELSTRAMGSAIVDFTTAVFNANNNANGSLAGGVQFELHGTWLYIDPASVGAPQITLFSDADDSRSFAALPGMVITFPFDRVRVFSAGPCTNSTLQAFGATIQPTLKFFYGVGRCPFMPSNLMGSTLPIIYNPGTLNSSAVIVNSTPVAFPSGSVISASLEANQVTAAAETSILLSDLKFTFIDGTLIHIQPDFSNDIQQVVAGAGTARAWSKWFPFRAPKHAISVQLDVQNKGSAATNPITFATLEIMVA